MVGARKRVDGQLSAWHLAGIVGFMPFTGKALDPEQINPFGAGGGGSGGAQRRIADVKAFINARGVAALGGIGRA